MRPADMPSDIGELIKLADVEYAKETAASMENIVLAVDKGLEKDPNNFELLWRGARACAWLTEEFPQHDALASWSEKGVTYARKAMLLQEKRVEGYYYYGINLGQSARTKTVGAYLMVNKVKKAGETAIKLDEKYDHAGPDRLLGNLFAKAPPWPASIGDTDEGVHYLKRAVDLAGDYVQNHLHYGDALYSDGQYDAAAKEYDGVLAWQIPPELAHRGERWKHEAQEGLKKVAAKKAGG